VPDTPAIALRGLTKRYGTQVAVDDLTLSVMPGSVCGLLGPNGAGKTTTFKCLLGFAHPSAGSVDILGAPVGAQTFLDCSYVPERSAVFPKLTVLQHLEFLRRTHPRYDAARGVELVRLFGLDERKRAGKLSKGQQTALQVVLAFSTRPRVMILDEPASGLDPVHQRQVLDLIIDAASSGAAIIVSSHQIGQIERAADRVAMIARGALRLDAAIEDLRTNEKVVEAVFSAGIPELDGIVHRAAVRRVERNGTMLRIAVSRDAGDLAAALGAAGASGVRTIDRTLEDIFIDAVTQETR
jgi:ABC-2 type transport system ATP-binding protein